MDTADAMAAGWHCSTAGSAAVGVRPVAMVARSKWAAAVSATASSGACATRDADRGRDDAEADVDEGRATAPPTGTLEGEAHSSGESDRARGLATAPVPTPAPELLVWLLAVLVPVEERLERRDGSEPRDLAMARSECIDEDEGSADGPGDA